MLYLSTYAGQPLTAVLNQRPGQRRWLSQGVRRLPDPEWSRQAEAYSPSGTPSWPVDTRGGPGMDWIAAGSTQPPMAVPVGPTRKDNRRARAIRRSAQLQLSASRCRISAQVRRRGPRPAGSLLGGLIVAGPDDWFAG